MSPSRNKTIQPLWVRVCHWLNAISVIVMMSSGWRIYNASPLFDGTFPAFSTLGGWLAGALQWHFAAMWLFGINGLFYLLMNVLSGRLKQRFWPLNLQTLSNELLSALQGKLLHNNLRHYNMVQRVMYLLVIADCILLTVSGLVLWKPVQFPLLHTLLGGYEFARYVHFFAMSLLFSFTLLHTLMVILVPKTLLGMLRGH